MRAIREETVVCVFCFRVPSDPAEKILNASGQTEAGFDLLQKVCIVCYCKVYSVACIVEEKSPWPPRHAFRAVEELASRCAFTGGVT